jgi:phosphate transport system permease protein
MRIPPRYAQYGAIIVLGSGTAVTVIILLFIVGFVLEKGLPVLNLSFLLGKPEDM